MRVEITQPDPTWVQITVFDRLMDAPEPAPESLFVDLDPATEFPISTEPWNHSLSRREGRWGAPGKLVQAARGFAAGDIDRARAESEITEALEEWSQESPNDPRGSVAP
jgi:hypothetical protein